MRFHHSCRSLSIVALALGLLGTSVPIAAYGTAGSETAACSEESWIGGTSEWCDGWFVHRDYVYDDNGADLEPSSPHGSDLARATGDVDHRDHGQALNSADLLVLRLRAEGDELVARFELNTLFEEDATVAALAIDTDDDPRTGGGPWGVIGVSSTGWDEVYLFDDRDPEANVIIGRAPLPRAPGRSVRVQAVVALGDGTPMNVAFRPGEGGMWWEDQQAAALAAGDISAFGATVAVGELRAGTHRLAALPGPGVYERIYRSEYPIAEGVDYQLVPDLTTATFRYLGRHQPYALYIPPGPAPYGVQLVLHGRDGGHAFIPSMLGVLGAEPNRILISPLGRGPANQYVDWGARDVLDALADVEATYQVDQDAVLVSGYSMGGQGTLQLATWFPDRFAGGMHWVGPTGDCLNGTPLAQGRQWGLTSLQPVHPYFSNSPDEGSGCPFDPWGNTLDFLENTRHVPIAHLYGAADQLVWVNHALVLGQRMEQLGYVHRLWLHAADHLTLAILGDWRKEAAWTSGLRRVQRPATVTYRTNTYLWVPELDLVPDGAYWLDELRPRNDSPTPDGDMVADLTSHACSEGHRQDVTIRRDAGTDPVLWIGQEGVASGAATPREPGRRISGTLTNVASLLIDLDKACLAPGADLDLDIRTDGPTVVRFSDHRPPTLIAQATG